MEIKEFISLDTRAFLAPKAKNQMIKMFFVSDFLNKTQQVHQMCVTTFEILAPRVEAYSIV